MRSRQMQSGLPNEKLAARNHDCSGKGRGGTCVAPAHVNAPTARANAFPARTVRPLNTVRCSPST
eukprot:129707-Chlamydomonas_euryale.AAC.1